MGGGGGAGDFLEQGGLLVFEAEAQGTVPAWSITTIGGATGIIGGANHFSNQGGGTINFPIRINTPGVYRINWRNFYSGSNGTEENDSWLKLPNNSQVWFFGYKGSSLSESQMIAKLQSGNTTGIVYPKGSSRVTTATTPAGSGGNGYFKIYRSGGASQVYDWQARTSDNDPHNVYAWFTQAGTYTLQISERSLGHAIDRVALYKLDGPAYTDSQLTQAAPSPRDGGSAGASANSPYSVTVQVTDSGNNVSAEQFTWIVNPAGTPEEPSAFSSFTLINADADSDFFDLSDGMQIGSATLGGASLNIRANASIGGVGSVYLELTGTTSATRVENVAPYALFGDSNGNYFGQTLGTGSYTIKATAYSGSNLSGTKLGADTVSFSIINSGKNMNSPEEVKSETEAEITILLHPNPAFERSSLQIDHRLPKVSEMYLFDASGKLVRNFNLKNHSAANGEYEVQVSGLEAGIYHLRMITEDGQQFTRSLIVR